jgi:hypothetical protein
MDETGCPPLHRFLSFCRILMLYHPRVGARNYSQHLFGHTDLKPGWNAMHSPAGAAVELRYIFIGPEGGLNSETKPDVPDDRLHHVYETDLPPYETSLARRHLLMLAEMVAARGIEGYGAAELQQIVAAIDVAGQQPLRGDAPSVDERISRDFGRLKQAIAEGGPVNRLIEPLLDAIRDGMRFRLSSTHAANILALLLAQVLRLPSPLDKTSLPERMSATVDHLIDLTVTLKDDRQRLKLTPYFDATYLALILGAAALILCRQAAAQFPQGSDTRRSFERRGLYVDELAAHDLAPCLMHPVDLAPFVPPEFQHAVSLGIIDAGGIYAGAGEQGKGPVAVASTWDKIEAYAASAADSAILASLETDNSPLQAGDVERLQMFLLTMQLGRGG